MAEFLDEQDQMELVKQYWKKYGISAIVAVLAMFGGSLLWQFWQARQAESLNAASVDYQYLLREVAQGESSKAQKIAHTIVENYSKTPYAGVSGLFLAQQSIEAKQWTEAETWLMFAEKHLKAPLKSVAVLRLARLKLQEKNPDAALKLLDSEDSSLPLIQFLKGQAYEMKHQNSDAKSAYESALNAINAENKMEVFAPDSLKTEVKSPEALLKRWIESRLNSL